MGTLFIGQLIRVLEVVESTNTVAMEWVREKPVAEGAVVQAYFQTRGKGQAGTHWVSTDKKNILLSVILKPQFLEPQKQFFLNQAISIAVAKTVAALTKSKAVKIKWPNDILCNEKKVAGILIESVVKGNIFETAIAGIGLNVNQEIFDSFPNASSLKLITKKDFGLNDVRDELFVQLEKYYLLLKTNQIELLQKEYMKILFRLEEVCEYKKGNEIFRAKIVGLTPEGKLVLNWNNRSEAFGSKEIELVM